MSSTGVIGTMVFNNNGAVSGSLPTGPFNPDVYDLQIAAFGHWDTFSGAAGYSYSVTATVSADITPAIIHWKNPAGGSFDDSNNWDPPQVPIAIDTAVFDQSSLLGLIPVNAPNDAVANMSISEMLVELTGFLQVLQGDSSGNGFQVTQGGQVLLTNPATLITANGWVGSGGTPPSSVTVTGPGTHWTVGSANPLSIFDNGKVIVAQGGLLNAQKEIDLGRFGTPGAMEVHNNALVTTPVLNVTAGNGASTLLIDSGGQVQA